MALLPILPVPAVFFMSGAGEKEGDVFFRMGVTHSLTLAMHNETLCNIPYAHTYTASIAFKLNVIRTAVKVEAVMGYFFSCHHSFTV